VLTEFSLSLVRPGHCDRSLSRTLARLSHFRQSADHGDPFPIDPRQAFDELGMASHFVARAEAFSTSGT
jgi:hypothetical protein